MSYCTFVYTHKCTHGCTYNAVFLAEANRGLVYVWNVYFLIFELAKLVMEQESLEQTHEHWHVCTVRIHSNSHTDVETVIYIHAVREFQKQNKKPESSGLIVRESLGVLMLAENKMF